MTNEQGLVFIIGIILNQSIPSDQVWGNVKEFRRRIIKRYGKFDYSVLMNLDATTIQFILRDEEKCLHRFPKNMANYIHGASETIFSEFDGCIVSIWEKNKALLSEKEILKNLIRIPGIGSHKAKQGIAMLMEIYNNELSLPLENYLRSSCPNFLLNKTSDINNFLGIV